MKPIMIVLSIFTIVLVSNNLTQDLVIPDEAIRVRVVANSNSAQDQAIKQIVKSAIEKEISQMLIDADSVNVARSILKNNISNINKLVNNVLVKNNVVYEYKVDFGYNYFPKKKYKGIVYNEGKYESIVITLGSGKGDNWWCILFPPLCMMESSEEELEEVEYKSYIKELIDKYF